MDTLINLFETKLAKVERLAASTVAIYTNSVKAFTDFSLNTLNTEPVRANGSDICAFIKSQKEAGTGNSRLENHQVALKRFFAMLQRMELRQGNPAECLMPLPKKATSPRSDIPTADVWRTLKTIDRSSWMGLRNHMIIAMLWCLGLRIEELRQIRVKDFEVLSRKKIGRLEVHGKGLKDRTLFVVDQVFDLVTCYLSHPDTPQESDSPIFTGPNGLLSQDQIRRVIRQAARKAAVKERITPHMFRHAFATELYHKKVPLNVLQHMMGHVYLHETAQYVHLKEDLKRKALSHIKLTGRTK